jgi:hypothetical protein
MPIKQGCGDSAAPKRLTICRKGTINHERRPIPIPEWGGLML